MKTAYPIILTQGAEYVVVSIPDFHINTQGTDLADAIAMARDAIGLMGIDMEEDGEALPTPSSIRNLPPAEENSVFTLVDIDFEEYRRKHESRAVKKNCTIPSWLNAKAEKAGLNFSAILQAALKEELKIGK